MKVSSKRNSNEALIQKNLPLNQIIARNLQQLAKMNGLSEAEIARKIDCPPQTLNRMFRGQTSDPKISIIRRLSNLFEIPISNLLSENLSAGFDNYKMLPLLEWEELSEIDDLAKLTSKDTSRNWQPVSNEISDGAFLLKSMKSMASRFPYGTIFVIEPNMQPIDGDIIIIHFRKNNIFTARELIIDGPEWKLRNISGEQESLTYQGSEHKIIGVVVEKRFFQTR